MIRPRSKLRRGEPTPAEKQAARIACRERAGGMCEKEVAGELQVTPQYICDILKGRREISEALAIRLGYKRVTQYVRES